MTPYFVNCRGLIWIIISFNHKELEVMDTIVRFILWPLLHVRISNETNRTTFYLKYWSTIWKSSKGLGNVIFISSSRIGLFLFELWLLLSLNSLLNFVLFEHIFFDKNRLFSLLMHFNYRWNWNSIHASYICCTF